MSKSLNLSIFLLPLGIIADERLAPFTIDVLLRKRVMPFIDAFKGQLFVVVVKFLLKTNFYHDIRRNDAIVT